MEVTLHPCTAAQFRAAQNCPLTTYVEGWFQAPEMLQGMWRIAEEAEATGNIVVIEPYFKQNSCRLQVWKTR